MLAPLVPLLIAAGGWATGDAARIEKGREVYALACQSCHGADGRGNPEWESEVRPIEFSDCGTTAEPSELWEAIVREGGKPWGLASVMPAYGEAFSAGEISAVVAYLRTFCEGADRYPPGDLNFRRPLKTGKAFPEQEVVLRATHGPLGAEGAETELELSYENRLGSRFQYELVLPLADSQLVGAGLGPGDVEIEGKQVVYFDQRKLDILSLGLGVKLPTGSASKDLGAGTVRVAPFVAYGKAWGRGRTIFQGKLGGEIPVDDFKADTQIKYAVTFLRALGPPRRAWTPAIEFSGAWSLKRAEAEAGRSHEYSLWLETSKPLNALGHVIASVGVQVPLKPSGERYRLEAYLLWDFGDGPFWAGW